MSELAISVIAGFMGAVLMSTLKNIIERRLSKKTEPEQAALAFEKSWWKEDKDPYRTPGIPNGPPVPFSEADDLAKNLSLLSETTGGNG